MLSGMPPLAGIGKTGRSGGAPTNSGVIFAEMMAVEID